LEDLQTQLHAAAVDVTLGDTAQIILGEVLNNIVEHAYKFEDGRPITVRISVRSDGLWCDTYDEGHPMPNGVPPCGVMPDIDVTTPADLPEGGFGWAMVRELTQCIGYTRKGSVNHLSFLIPSPQA
jgi:serine/threonine-protein kinase RsbW